MRFACLEKARVIIARANACNACEYVKHLVTISISNIVTRGLMHVDWEMLLLVAGDISVGLNA